jgi:hypothetical protein
MLTAVAPETLKDSVTGCPGVELDGVAVNQEITGVWGTDTMFCQDT